MNIMDNYNLAVKYSNENNFDNAIEIYKEIIKKTKNNVKYLSELGDIYVKTKNLNNAIECYEKILVKEPKNIIVINQLGVCHNMNNNNKKAIEYFKKIIDNNIHINDVYNNISVCYIALKDYINAEKYYLLSYKLKNDTHINNALGSLYFYMKQYDKSISYYNKHCKTDQESYNLCFPYLAKKDFTTGFKLYESRLKFDEKSRVMIPWLSYWDGVMKCDNLLILYEQGIGDNIQYFRFIVTLSELYPNMHITYFCKDIVADVFKKYKNIDVVKQLTINKFNYKLYIMSLPFILQLKNIEPNKENYINVNNIALELWKNPQNGKLSSLKRMKVGFTYNGLLTSFIEKYIPLKEFKQLFDLDIDIICIHKLNDISKEDMDMVCNRINFYDIDCDKPFEDTIAILQSIDLLITIDTYIVHIAGVLGVKTFLLLGYGSDWRWSNSNTNYWYNSVELIRMTENKELKNILQIVKNKIININ